MFIACISVVSQSISTAEIYVCSFFYYCLDFELNFMLTLEKFFYVKSTLHKLSPELIVIPVPISGFYKAN